MKSLLKKSLICIAGLALLSGCVVYERPRPYVYRTYEVYDGPEVVYVHREYYGRGYYVRR